MAIQGVIIDLDGCVYVGDRPVEGVAKTIKELRQRGLKLLFLTNNATKTPEEYVNKLKSMGIDASQNEILTSGIIAASYVRRVYGKSKIYVVGTQALENVLTNYGHEIVDSNADIVIVGLDFNFNYQKLLVASTEIRRGAKFIATNTDSTIPVEEGLLPGAGSIVKAIEVASGVKPVVVGKPSKIALREALRRIHVKPENAIVVGDRPETDVKMGKRFQCKTVLVLTGVIGKEGIKALPKKLKPDFVIESLNDLISLIDVMN